MKLKDLRKVFMNTIIDRLREKGALANKELWALMPIFDPIGFATAQHMYCDLLMELCDRRFVGITRTGVHNAPPATYAVHDRMFDERGMYIGNTLIDPEWPDTWKRK